MLCVNCSKLMLIFGNKKCLKCQGAVNITIASLCNKCSESNKSCQICLKKTDNKNPLNITHKAGCNSCSKSK